MSRISATRKHLERIGRQCVKDMQSDGYYTFVVGSLPRHGFPKGSKIRDRSDGQLERLFVSEKLLAAIQTWMRNNIAGN